MDNTLFDHDKALKRDMLKISSPSELTEWELHGYDFWKEPHVRNRVEMIRSQPNWWRNLERYEPGWKILEIAESIGFDIKILTKGPKKKAWAWTEKVECIFDHFGPDMPVDIVGEDKQGTYGRVLVDDWPGYLKGWLEHRPRGLAIMPAQRYNEDFKHPRVVRFTGDNTAQVCDALHVAFNRKQGEDLKL